MLLPLKGVITSKPRRDGNYIIYFQYCYSSSKRILLSSEIAIPRSYWNGKRQAISKSLPIEFGDCESLNKELLRIRKVIEDIISHGINSNVDNLGDFVKSIFRKDLDTSTLVSTNVHKLIVKQEPEFVSEIDNYIKSKQKSVSKGTLRTFRVMKERVVAFEKFRGQKVTFSSLDYNLYVELLEFLTYQYVLRRKKEIEYGLKTSTIGKTINQLRIFVKDRVRRKIVSPIDLTDFKAVDEESDAIYLTYEEIGRIYALDLSHDTTLAQYRDMFVFGCLTGLRFSDYSTLDYSDVRSDMLYKKTTKVDNWVIIPLRSEAKEIFERQFKEARPRISNPVLNKYIKEIAKRSGIIEPITFSHKKGNRDIITTKPKADWVTTHTCRRSFATNEYLAGTDISLIMRITGHKTQKQFFKYIRVSEHEAALKVQQIWLSRNNMAAFTVVKTA